MPSREATADIRVSYALPSLRDSAFSRDWRPWVYTHGYVLPSLRDLSFLQHRLKPRPQKIFIKSV